MPGAPMLVEELTVAHDSVASQHSVTYSELMSRSECNSNM